ncbi:MAG TPA: ribonuclease T [Acidobacteriaceae bacterium]|jgi:ribonuclease T2|nr:ribonuclease T [Acidobacteriaceae bacterium]
MQSHRLFASLSSFLSSLAIVTAMFCAASSVACAQNKGEPGNFDFYLLNMPWGPVFCSSISDVSPQCRPQHSFVVHGLWAQNNDGSYPVSCSSHPGPAHPELNLDITPDLQLLRHEWAKHGTCSNVGPDRFFRMEHEAFASIKIPAAFHHVDDELSMSPAQILGLFYRANPQLPRGSLVVSCKRNEFTAVEGCFTKGLSTMRCLGLHSCAQQTLKIEPTTTR